MNYCNEMVKFNVKEKKTSITTKDLTGDHPPPKKASVAWIFYNTEMSAKFRTEGNHQKAYTKSSQAWWSATEEVKAPYYKMAEEDSKRFARQTDELKKLGYYTLDDGSKSTDEKNKHLFKVKAKKGKD